MWGSAVCVRALIFLQSQKVRHSSFIARWLCYASAPDCYLAHETGSIVVGTVARGDGWSHSHHPREKKLESHAVTGSFPAPPGAHRKRHQKSSSTVEWGSKVPSSVRFKESSTTHRRLGSYAELQGVHDSDCGRCHAWAHEHSVCGSLLRLQTMG